MSRAGAAPEAETDFERQNPASKQLSAGVDKVLDEVLTSLAREVKEFLEEADQKESSKEG